MSDIFISSKNNIAKAKRLISDFEQQVAGFINAEPCALVSEVDADTAEEIHKVKFVKPAPNDLSRIAFETVGCLRSALDQAIAALNDGNTHFPIASDINDFEKVLNENCGHLPAEIIDLLRTFKPYKGGNNLLWALNEICSTDKHEIICPIAVARAGSIEAEKTFSRDSYLPAPVWDRAKNEMEIFRQPLGSRSEGDFDISYFIAMCDIDFIDGKQADVVLNDFVSLVEDILIALETKARRLNLI